MGGGELSEAVRPSPPLRSTDPAPTRRAAPAPAGRRGRRPPTSAPPGCASPSEPALPSPGPRPAAHEDRGRPGSRRSFGPRGVASDAPGHLPGACRRPFCDLRESDGCHRAGDPARTAGLRPHPTASALRPAPEPAWPSHCLQAIHDPRCACRPPPARQAGGPNPGCRSRVPRMLAPLHPEAPSPRPGRPTVRARSAAPPVSEWPPGGRRSRRPGGQPERFPTSRAGLVPPELARSALLPTDHPRAIQRGAAGRRAPTGGAVPGSAHPRRPYAETEHRRHPGAGAWGGNPSRGRD